MFVSQHFQIEHCPKRYRADFALHAVFTTLMAAYLIAEAPTERWVALGITVWLAAISWSLIEYMLHRFVLHAMHHSKPEALICTPIVLSATSITSLVFLPVWMLSDRWLATALTFGLLVGYLFYAVTHHAIHHGGTNGIWIRQRKLCHALHHDHSRPSGYFGVTSRLWDDVMGTAHRHDF